MSLWFRTENKTRGKSTQISLRNKSQDKDGKDKGIVFRQLHELGMGHQHHALGTHDHAPQAQISKLSHRFQRPLCLGYLVGAIVALEINEVIFLTRTSTTGHQGILSQRSAVDHRGTCRRSCEYSLHDKGSRGMNASAALEVHGLIPFLVSARLVTNVISNKRKTKQTTKPVPWLFGQL